MCRVLAICSENPDADADLMRRALLDFRTLATTGVVAGGLPPGHEDGWGLVAYRGGAPLFYLRALGRADADLRFSAAADLVRDLSPDTVIAHLRKASRGSLSIENTQPLLADHLAFCHNGSLTVGSPEDVSHQSDSAITFRRALAAGGRAEDLEREIAIGQSGDYTAAITILADGARVRARRQWNESHPEAKSRGFDGYFTLRAFEGGTLRAVCSEPLPALGSLSGRDLANGEAFTLRA